MLANQEMQMMVSEAARQAANNVVNEMFLRVGLDPDRPLENQSTFATLRDLHTALRDPEVKEDIVFIRKFRTGFQRATTKAMIMAVTALLTGVTSIASWAATNRFWVN